MIEQVIAILRQPGPAAVGYFLLGLLGWRLLPPRERVLALATVGAVSAIALQPLFESLRPIATSPPIEILETTLLFAILTATFAPIVLAVDRIFRDRSRSLIRNRGRWVAYVLAVLTGLVACLASIGGLWWVTDVQPGIQGSFELALFGGVVTSCVALVRADRASERRPDSSVASS